MRPKKLASSLSLPSRLALHTQNIEDFAAKLAPRAAFKVKKTHPAVAQSGGDIRIHRLDLGQVLIDRLEHRIPCLGTFLPRPDFVLALPIDGRMQRNCAGESTLLIPPHGIVENGGQPVDLNIEDFYDGVILYIPRAFAENFCSSLLPCSLETPLKFAAALDMTTPDIRHLLDVLIFAASVPDDKYLFPVFTANIQQLLMATLLYAQPHNHSDILTKPDMASYVPPTMVRRAKDFMEENIDKPISMLDVAEAANTSLRNLQRGFRQHFDISPAQWLKRKRLEKVRSDLVSREAVKTITQTAMKWGFYHMGDFSRQYRVRFGETPSETIRKKCS